MRPRLSNANRKQKADPKLQQKLRTMVDTVTFHQVSLRLGIGREALLRYLGDVPQRTEAFRGIEASIRAVDVDTPEEWERQVKGQR